MFASVPPQPPRGCARALRGAAAASWVALTAAVSASCAASTGAELEPRYVAVHNAMAAMGLAEVGPLQRGSLAQGREARVTVQLGGQCATIVALGGAGVADLDTELLDPDGKPVAHDTTTGPEAAVRACVDKAGTYTLVVKMARGAGDFVTATWTGGGGPAGGAQPAGAPAALASTGLGTCDSPIPLVAGTVTASTTRGESEHEGKCANSASRELVYKMELTSRQRVTIDVDPRFDAVLYVRKDDCTDEEAEVEDACNDDDTANHTRHSRVDVALDPGTYYVFVDGYSNESGSFRMTTSMSDAPTLAEVCQRARPLSPGLPVIASNNDAFDNAHASCADGAKGGDAPYKLDVAQRARVRITEKSDELSPVVHVRRACADEASEVACANTGATDEEATFAGMLDPGTYAVFADATDRGQSGRYTLLAEVAPEAGTAGAQGDACADALGLSSQSDHAVSGDTFLARDDFAGKCGGTGGADVVYKVDVPRRSRVAARFTRQEGRHLFVLMRTCGDRATELACGAAIDELVAPGTYYLAIDGARADALGRFTFDWRVREVANQENACRAAPMLVEGQAVNGTTSGAGDKFTTSCGGREDTQTSPDRMYRIALAKRTHVRLTLSTPTWDGVLAIRRSCLDPRGAEAACNNDSEDTHHARIDAVLEAGTYFVQVDGHASGNEGPFTLEYRVVR